MSDPETKAVKAVQKTAKAVEQQSRQIADSAQDLQQSSAQVETSAETTTRLAADRNVLAAERTYAAWMRTGLFAFASGVGARALLTDTLPEWLIQSNATALILFSVFCFAAAVWRSVNPGPPPPNPDVKPIPAVILIAISAFLAVISLSALIGIWLPGNGGTRTPPAKAPVAWSNQPQKDGPLTRLRQT